MMRQLLRKPENNKLEEGVTLVHELMEENSDLRYVSFKVINLEPNAQYEEKLTKLEVCAVVLTGLVTITDGVNQYAEIETSDIVFESKQTNRDYVFHNKTVTITANTKARVALCFAPSDKELPSKLIKAEDNSVEHRGKYNNKRQVHNILPDSDPSANSLLVVEVITE